MRLSHPQRRAIKTVLDQNLANLCMSLRPDGGVTLTVGADFEYARLVARHLGVSAHPTRLGATAQTPGIIVVRSGTDTEGKTERMSDEGTSLGTHQRQALATVLARDLGSVAAWLRPADHIHVAVRDDLRHAQVVARLLGADADRASVRVHADCVSVTLGALDTPGVAVSAILRAPARQAGR
jgi:hypothetical protein